MSLLVGPHTLKSGESWPRVEPKSVPKMLPVVLQLYFPKDDGEPSNESVPRNADIDHPTGLVHVSTGVDDGVHDVGRDAEHDDFGLLEGMVQPDRIGEARTLFIGLNQGNMASIPPNVFPYNVL